MAKKLAAIDLLEELLMEILILLPVKSLLICKSVCKTWLHLISNPDFIKTRLDRAIVPSKNNLPTLLSLEDGSTTNVPLPYLFQIFLDYGDQYVYFDDYDDGNQQHQKHTQLVNEALLDTDAQDLSHSPLNFNRLVKPRIFLYNHRVVGSYNGIICLANVGFNDIYLWNPTIRMYKKIPPPPPHTSIAVEVKIGFGYDSISDDYKVARFVYYHKDDKVMIVQVYSTNSNSWRAFQEPMLNNWKIYKPTNVVVNGVMYFDDGDELIAFDLHKEVFGLVPFPSFIQRKRSHVMDFEGSVAMVFEYGQGIDLWTLDDVSGQMSWTKKFSIHTDPETEIRLSCYLGAGQFYGTKFCDGEYLLYDVLYDYKKRETKYHRIGEQNVHANLKYTETLVSLDGFQLVESEAN